MLLRILRQILCYHTLASLFYEKHSAMVENLTVQCIGTTTPLYTDCLYFPPLCIQIFKRVNPFFPHFRKQYFQRWLMRGQLF